MHTHTHTCTHTHTHMHTHSHSPTLELANYERNVNRNIHKYTAYRWVPPDLRPNQMPSSVRSSMYGNQILYVWNQILYVWESISCVSESAPGMDFQF